MKQEAHGKMQDNTKFLESNAAELAEKMSSGLVYGKLLHLQSYCPVVYAHAASR